MPVTLQARPDLSGWNRVGGPFCNPDEWKPADGVESGDLGTDMVKTRWQALVLTGALALAGATVSHADLPSDPQKQPKSGSVSPKKKKKSSRKKKTVDAGVKIFAIKAEAPVTGVGEDGEPRLNVRLIWGTSSEAAAQSGFQTLEPELAVKLEKVFPWKSYFQILDKDFDAPRDGFATETLSPKARLRVRAQGNSRFRLSLFGEGNRVVNRTVTIGDDDIVALAGYDEHRLGWFIVLKRARPGSGDDW